MKTMTVLVLEDRPVLRTTVAHGLMQRGFDVITAGSAAEAWSLIENVADLDVALLDIHLGEGPVSTGLDFGLRLKQARSVCPPEFLVFSAYDNPDYYQTAMTLGAAAYLRKGVFGGDPGDPGANRAPRVAVLAQHVRALALRRALRGDRPDMAARMEKIAEDSRSQGEAIRGFCRDILADSLATVLGDTFVLLLTHGETTTRFSAAQQPVTSEAFSRVQAVVHSRPGDDRPIVITPQSDWISDVAEEDRHEMQALLREISGAAFVSLGDAKTFRLSLGILPGSPNSYEGSVIDQAAVVERYMQHSVMRSILDLTEMTTILERRRSEAMLRSTVDFCFYQGQELSNLLWEAEKSGSAEVAALRKLSVLAEEMRDAGELLMHFTSSGPAAEPQRQRVDISDVVGRIWTEEVVPRLRVADRTLLRVDGNCVVADQLPRTERIVSQILAWMVRRMGRLDPVVRDMLVVRCSTVAEEAKAHVVFEELATRRVPRQLRETMFSPFFSSQAADPLDEVPNKERRLGLYFAHTLATLAGGSLTDRSDDIEGSCGHRFLLELPAASA